MDGLWNSAGADGWVGGVCSELIDDDMDLCASSPSPQASLTWDLVTASSWDTGVTQILDYA